MKTNLLLFLIFSVVVGGCYTVYNHPNVVHKDNNNMVEIVEVTYKNDCQSCHTTDELENYNYYVKKEVFIEPDSLDQSTELRYNDIAYFYNMPWWFEVELSNQFNEVKYEANYEPTSTENDRTNRPPVEILVPGIGTQYIPPTVSRPTTSTGVSNSNNNNKSSGSENTTTTNSNSSGTSNTRGNDGSKNDGSRNNNSGRR